MDDITAFYRDTNIRVGNMIIARFMGIEVLNDWDDPDALKKIGPKSMLPSQLSYYTSWEWMAPVVQKIIAECGEKWEYPDRTEILEIQFALRYMNLTLLFAEVIKYIQWHESDKS